MYLFFHLYKYLTYQYPYIFSLGYEGPELTQLELNVIILHLPKI